MLNFNKTLNWFKHLQIFEILNICKPYINNISLYKNTIYVYPSKSKQFDFLYILKNSSYFLFKILSDIGVVDFPKKKKRFKLTYILLSTIFNLRLHVTFFLNSTSSINSVYNLWESSTWAEREVWDMFGIWFTNSKDTRKILTDYNFQGYPLRKEFPLIGYNEIYFNESNSKIMQSSISMVQPLRKYNFNN
jgi:NADH-quinone oxidoreductase subunit C